MFIKYCFHPFLWAICMFLLNLGRKQALPSLQVFYFLYFDKVAHFFQFSLLSFMLVVAFSKQSSYFYVRLRAIWISTLLCLSYALLLEGIHLFLAFGYFEWGDLIADISGVFFGLLLFYLIYKL